MVAADPTRIAPHASRPVVLYKGSCPFCRAAARAIERLDKSESLALLPFDDADAVQLMDPIPEVKREASWHLVHPDGTYLSAGPATVELMLYLPAFRWLGHLLKTLHLTWLVGLLYRGVSRSRAQLSRFFSGAPGPRRFP